MPLDIRLLEYEQTGEIVNGQTWREERFVGLTPILLRDPEAVNVLVQRGRARAWGVIFVEPPPLFSGSLLEPVRVSRKRVDEISFETTWSYVMAVDTGYVLPTSIMAWPTSPAFLAAPD